MTEDDVKTLDPYVQWIVAEARRPVSVDDAARHRLLEALRAEPQPTRRRLDWLVEPRRFVLPPLATAALAAGLVGIGVISGLLINRDGQQADQRPADVADTPRLPGSIASRAVKFVLIAPQAARVAVVGDFNGWDVSASPMTTQGKDGTWTIFLMSSRRSMPQSLAQIAVSEILSLRFPMKILKRSWRRMIF